MAVLTRFVVALLGALALLALLDLLGEAVATHAGAFGGGGLLASLPGGLGRWLVPPPEVLWSTTGFVLLGGLALAAAGLPALAARLGGPRLAAALALLVGVAAPLSIWNPLGLFILAGQTMGLAALTVARGAPSGAWGEGAVRLLGLAAAVLLTWTAAPAALVVTLIAVALAPALLSILAAPVTPAAPQAASAPAPVDSGPVGAPAPEPEPESKAHGPFGPDPVAAHDHLMPAATLIAEGHDALAVGAAPVLVVVRLDGLAGIATHLGADGGAALFAEASGRLADALPAGGHLAWIGDETFAALLPAPSAEDLETLGGRLAAPFAADLHVGGRTVSMEDALHIDANALDAAVLDELAAHAGIT